MPRKLRPKARQANMTKLSNLKSKADSMVSNLGSKLIKKITK